MSALPLPVALSQKNNLADGRWSFAALAAVMILVSIVGFAPSLAHPARRNAPISMLAAVHGLVFFAWQILFLAQSLLVATRRVAVHRRLGLAGVFLYVGMIVLGSVTTITMGRRGFDLSGDLRLMPHPKPGYLDPIAGMLFPLTDLAMFAVLAGAALALRRRREIHKRLMLFANIMLIPAALTHAMGHRPELAALPAPVIMVPVGLFLAAAVARDYLAEHRVHPLTWTTAIVIFASGPLRAFLLGPSSAWQHFASWLLR